MPGKIPDIIWLYRIVHVKNVKYLLTHGMFHRNHPDADKDYVNIGDSDLIAKRNEYPVKIVPPGETLGRYVPFYFGPLSPMLYNIKTGHRGITKCEQSDIVYVVCKASNIIQQCPEWCFTDGHAKTAITLFYNDLNNIGEVDWNIVNERYWNNTDEDFDRMRRKQAEFLVKDFVPAHCIAGLGVYNEKTRILVQSIIDETGLDIPVKVATKSYY